MRRSLAWGFVLAVVFASGGWVAADRILVHERKEVAGLSVLFGAEPEPALDGEVEFLRWRVTGLADSQPYQNMESAEVTIRLGGGTFGPFPVQGVRADPGLYQTRHIFTEPGQYQSTLSFRKGEETVVHTVDFEFRINARQTIELPPRR